MTERQIKLVKDYGPRLFERSSRILDDLLYIVSDALSVMTDEEWAKYGCGEELVAFSEKLSETRSFVYERLMEVGADPLKKTP